MRQLRLLLPAVIFLGGWPPAVAQTPPHQVEVFSNYFSPSVRSIAVGETVRWVARNSGHTVVADDGRFRFPATGTLSAGESAEFTFAHADEIVRYRCTVHSEMRGAIKVGNPPPTSGTGEPTEIRLVPSPTYPTIAAALAGIPRGAAIDLAPGVYDTAITLEVDGVRLRGRGAAPTDVVLNGGGVRGIGVSGRASGLWIENLTIRAYTVAGLSFTDADGFVVTTVRVDAALGAARGSYGIVATRSRYGRIGDATVANARIAGIGLDGCTRCDTVVDRTVARDNTIGLQARGAGSLVVFGSVFTGNVTGIALLNPGEHGTSAGAHLFGNTIRANTAPYVGRPTDPLGLAPNVGIWVDGGRHIAIERNLVEEHRYGIALTGTGGATLVNRIQMNVIDGSTESDLAWDGIGAATCFSSNTSASGAPPRSEPPMIETVYGCGAPAPGIPMPLTTARVLRATG